MRVSRLFALTGSLAAIAVAVACTPPQPTSNIDGTQAAGNAEEDDTEDAAATPAEKKPAPKATTDGGSGPVNDTCIGKAGFTFDDGATCDTCMSEQDGCCQKLIACFKDDPNCSALQGCADACNTGGMTGDGGTDGGRDGGGGGGGGNGTGGGTGTGGGGGGALDGGADGGLKGKACVDACKTKYATAVPAWDAYQGCITTTCKTQCQ